MDTSHSAALACNCWASCCLRAQDSYCTRVVYYLLWVSETLILCVLFSLDAHAIYLLNLLLAFLQPKFDPSLQEDLLADEIEGGGEAEVSPLPSQRDDEFRPFVRRLPEWQFWLSSTRATVVALLCTTSEVFDVPVYWPILVVYFLVLFTLTMRRQIQHMIKYKYVPFDFGRKTRYGVAK
ncbi:retention in endoplasmic reticulum protein 1 [Leucoagaricus gongylophorus]